MVYFELNNTNARRIVSSLLKTVADAFVDFYHFKIDFEGLMERVGLCILNATCHLQDSDISVIDYIAFLNTVSYALRNDIEKNYLRRF